MNSPHVVQESFDGDVVVVNLDSGTYFCLQGSGAEIWKLLVAGHSLGRAARILGGVYAASPAEIENASAALVRELQEQGLIVPAPEPSGLDGAGGPAAASPAPARPFDAPRLQVYTDMQDLLLLDPIHEVDEAGWPVAKRPPGE